MPIPFIADYEFDALTEITPSWLRAHGIKALLMDFDNTMIPYTTAKADDALLVWREKLCGEGVALMIVSNSRKSRRVPDFAEEYDFKYIRHAGKPNPKGIRRALKILDLQPEQAAMVGDQTYTDILGGNLAHVTSILVRPIHCNVLQALRRCAEMPFILIGRILRK